MPRELSYTETLTTTSCWCGIHLAIPDNLYRWLKQSEKNHCHCPLGHQFVFSNTLEKQLEEAREETKRQRRRAQAERDLREAEERSHTATKGHLTRMKKRVIHGVCPFCSRHFANVERHMASRHPGETTKA